MSTDEMKLVSNFEHGLCAFYKAEGALNTAAAGYKQTGYRGPYTYGSAFQPDQPAAVAEITEEYGFDIIRATGYSGDITKHVQVRIQMQDGRLLFSNWQDYGLDN